MNLKHMIVGLGVGVSVGASTVGEATAAPPPVVRSAIEILGTPAGTVMTKEYVATVGRFAYLWGWALVNNYNRSLAVKDLPEPGRIGGVIPGSPHNQVSMLTDCVALLLFSMNRQHLRHFSFVAR